MNLKTRSEAERAKSTAVLAARGIARKATNEGRNLTADERDEVSRFIADAKSADAALRGFDGDQALLDSLSILGRPRGGTASHDFGWAKAYRASGYKDAITPSGTITAPALSPGIAPLEDRPTSFLSAITFVPLDGTDGFQYTREELRTLNARSVARGTIKPTSTVELVPVTDRARTVAHLTGGIDRATLADTDEVGSFLEDVLAVGVLEALEAMVLHGDSTVAGGRDDFDGILETSGIQSQPFDTDRLTSLRKALTLLQKAKLTGPFMYVMSSATWEALELTKDSDHYVMGDPGTSGRTVPVDSARQAVWGTRVALSEEIGDDTALVGDFSPTSIRVRERERTRIDWSEATQLQVEGEAPGTTATGFSINRVQLRAEARYGLELRRPWAFAEVDLAAGS